MGQEKCGSQQQTRVVVRDQPPHANAGGSWAAGRGRDVWLLSVQIHQRRERCELRRQRAGQRVPCQFPTRWTTAAARTGRGRAQKLSSENLSRPEEECVQGRMCAASLPECPKPPRPQRIHGIRRHGTAGRQTSRKGKRIGAGRGAGRRPLAYRLFSAVSAASSEGIVPEREPVASLLQRTAPQPRGSQNKRVRGRRARSPSHVPPSLEGRSEIHSHTRLVQIPQRRDS
jgi:hypothetical protein